MHSKARLSEQQKRRIDERSVSVGALTARVATARGKQVVLWLPQAKRRVEAVVRDTVANVVTGDWVELADRVSLPT